MKVFHFAIAVIVVVAGFYLYKHFKTQQEEIEAAKADAADRVAASKGDVKAIVKLKAKATGKVIADHPATSSIIIGNPITWPYAVGVMAYDKIFK